jgi:hypothetical protein
VKEVLFDLLFWASCVVSVVSFAHVPIFLVATRWHGRNAQLVFAQPDQYALRKAYPPWYIRYSTWLLRRSLGRLDP